MNKRTAVLTDLFSRGKPGPDITLENQCSRKAQSSRGGCSAQNRPKYYIFNS